jgi:hypothetical protein
MTDDLFDAEFADAARAIQRETVAHVVRQKTAAIIRKQSRLQLRRAKSEETLAAVLPDRLPAGYSAHIISAGDVDALSFVAHIAKHHRRLDEVLISSWCLALPDIEWLEQQQSANRIGDLRFYCGEILRATYPDTYDAICRLERAKKATLAISRNHAKVTLIKTGAARYTIESSANLNTNPRIEQTAIHTDQELHAFYDEFFSAIHCIDAKNRRQEQACRP